MRWKIAVASVVLLAVIVALILAQPAKNPSASPAKTGKAAPPSSTTPPPKAKRPDDVNPVAPALEEPEAQPASAAPEEEFEESQSVSSVPPELIERFERLQQEQDASDQDFFGRGPSPSQDDNAFDPAIPPPSSDTDSDPSSTHSQLQLRGKSLWLDEK